MPPPLGKHGGGAQEKGTHDSEKGHILTNTLRIL